IPLSRASSAPSTRCAPTPAARWNAAAAPASASATRRASAPSSPWRGCCAAAEFQRQGARAQRRKKTRRAGSTSLFLPFCVLACGRLGAWAWNPSLSGRQGDADLEAGAVAAAVRLGVADLAALVLDEGAGGGQAEAEAEGLGGDEGLEEVDQSLRGDAGAGVL